MLIFPSCRLNNIFCALQWWTWVEAISVLERFVFIFLLKWTVHHQSYTLYPTLHTQYSCPKKMEFDRPILSKSINKGKDVRHDSLYLAVSPSVYSRPEITHNTANQHSDRGTKTTSRCCVVLWDLYQRSSYRRCYRCIESYDISSTVKSKKQPPSWKIQIMYFSQNVGGKFRSP